MTTTDGTLTINKAPLTVTAQPSTKTVGAANPAFTVSYAEFVKGDSPAVLGGTLVFTTTATGASPVGSYDVTPSGLTSANYTITFVKTTLTVHYEWDGFLQPINDTAHDLGTMSRFKAGQTIPAKFDLKDANGVIVTQSVNPTFNYKLIGGRAAWRNRHDCWQYPPSTVPIYTLTGGHYQYNWSTKGLAAASIASLRNSMTAPRSPSTSVSPNRASAREAGTGPRAQYVRRFVTAEEGLGVQRTPRPSSF